LFSRHAEKALFGSFHQREIGSDGDGEKSKLTGRQPRETEHARQRAEGQVNPDRHRGNTACDQGTARAAAKRIFRSTDDE
jgi:hypothetical protein